MCETNYDTLQPYFGQDKLQLQYMDCDSFVLSIETQNIIFDFKNLEYLFDFNNLNEDHEFFGNKNKKVIGKFKIETLKKILDRWICLFKSKA